MRYTIAEIAEKLNFDREIVRGLVKFLVEAGFAELMGERKSPNSRGASENVYGFKEGFEVGLAAMLVEARF